MNQHEMDCFERLMEISRALQKDLKKINDVLNLSEPVANDLGYTFDRTDGKLWPIKSKYKA